ncbi:2OG-Fe dioxygenase family protein [Acetobacteraceae bacterium H6797]|nr:2OG-Fe dioxygenase family protein [Acetobacteraceae bacterium H6797]
MALSEVSGTSVALADVAAAIRPEGFTFLHAEATEALLTREGLADWQGFAASWNDLGLDTYMADGGRYRRRRHAAFSASPEGIARKPHQPHYQSRDYNTLNGGIERWFEPVKDEVGEHPALHAILATCNGLFTSLTSPVLRPKSWHVEIHQFRIEAKPGEQGLPTPEGMHRDGVDWVMVLMIHRENVASAETSIHDLERRHLGSFTLEQPMDAAIVDDGRVYHGVTPVTPLDPAKPSWRDVLVVTFRHE